MVINEPRWLSFHFVTLNPKGGEQNEKQKHNRSIKNNGGFED